MNADSFIKEAMDYSSCPKDFQAVYYEFQEYQNMTDSILREFHRICEKHKIAYQLAYGSLLGAIRDKGQIPWDYDADVFVDFHKKDELISCLKRDLSDQFYFYCPEINSSCRHMFIRIAPIGYRSEEIHLDVFYITGAPGQLGSEEMHLYANRISYLANAIYYKKVNPIEACHGNWKRAIKLYMKKLQYCLKASKAMYSEYIKLSSRFDQNCATSAITPDTFCGDERYCFDYTTIWNTKLIETDIGTFRIPVEYDDILKKCYGEYMSYAPIEDRISEMYKNCYRLKKYASKS